MKNEKIEEMILEIIKTVDYDQWKYYMPELSEDPDAAETSMNELIFIVKKYLKDERQ